MDGQNNQKNLDSITLGELSQKIASERNNRPPPSEATIPPIAKEDFQKLDKEREKSLSESVKILPSSDTPENPLSHLIFEEGSIKHWASDGDNAHTDKASKSNEILTSSNDPKNLLNNSPFEGRSIEHRTSADNNAHTDKAAELPQQLSPSIYMALAAQVYQTNAQPQSRSVDFDAGRAAQENLKRKHQELQQDPPRPPFSSEKSKTRRHRH